MLFLTLQLALSSLSFLYNSPKFLPQIETTPAFETAWKANLDLAKSMSKDTKIVDILEPENWKMLKDVSSYTDLNDSSLDLFSVLEEILRISDVETIVQSYPEYQFALLTVTQLSASITELCQAEKKDLDCRDLNCRVGSPFKLPNHMSAQNFEDTITLENVVIMYQTALNMNMEDLKKAAEEFILFEFEDISNNDTNFPYLKIHELLPLLKSNKLTVPSEYLVFEAIVRWVMADTAKRSEHIPALMDSVRLHLCPVSLLNKMLDHSLLKGFSDILHSIRSAVYLIQLNSPILPELVKKQQRLLQETLFVQGGVTRFGDSANVETFSTFHQKWIYHERFTNGSTDRTNAVSLGKRIIFFRGASVLASSFEPVKEEWQSLARMPGGNSFHSVAVLNDMVYVLGGYTFSNVVSDDCMRYDPKSNSWTRIGSLNTARYHAFAVTLKDKVYIAGGVGLLGVYLNTVEVFNQATNRWSFVTPMKAQRYHFALATEGNCMWAFGGFNGKASLNSVERYDPESGTWTSMPAMPVANDEHNVAYFLGNFYVIGGKADQGKTVDIYNPRRKLWRRGPSLNVGRYFFGACVIKDLPNAADYVV